MAKTYCPTARRTLPRIEMDDTIALEPKEHIRPQRQASSHIAWFAPKKNARTTRARVTHNCKKPEHHRTPRNFQETRRCCLSLVLAQQCLCSLCRQNAFGNAEPEVVKPIDILVGRKVRSSFQLYRKRSLQLAKAQHLRNFMQLPTSLAQAPGTCVDQRADTSLTAWMRSCHVPQTK